MIINNRIVYLGACTYFYEVEKYEDRIAYLEGEVEYLKNNCILNSEVRE